MKVANPRLCDMFTLYEQFSTVTKINFTFNKSTSTSLGMLHVSLFVLKQHYIYMQCICMCCKISNHKTSTILHWLAIVANRRMHLSVGAARRMAAHKRVHAPRSALRQMKLIKKRKMCTFPARFPRHFLHFCHSCAVVE